MTRHQALVHQEYVEGCFGCKVATVGFYGAFPTRTNVDATREKKWQGECDSYRDAVKQGIEPDGTTKVKVEFAKAMSDKAGVPYGTAAYKQHLANRVLEKV